MGGFIPISLVFILGVSNLQPSLGHVSLTWPPSRQFPIDFLNTFWTKQPCGMPKGPSRTSLVAGQAFNATWHLGYAHQGGYRLELLDQNENKLFDLTPTNDNDFYQGHSTAQWHYIDIPENTSCSGCTIRLLRQVPEFSPNFQFISCADVDIVPRHHYTESCSGHGYVIAGGRCTCYARRWGDKCQYQEECDHDLDCNGVGRCLYLGGSALPRKQCFCPPSHYGTRCGLQNPSTLPSSGNINLKKHVRVKLDERITMYFKIVLGSSLSQDQIEFIMQINGTSYGALGWRPSNLGPQCKSWPFYSDALHSGHRINKRSSSSTFTITRSIDESETFGSRGQSPNPNQFQNYVSVSSSGNTVGSSSGRSHHDVSPTYSRVSNAGTVRNRISGHNNYYPNVQVIESEPLPRSHSHLQSQRFQNGESIISVNNNPQTPIVQSLPLPRTSVKSRKVVSSTSSKHSQSQSQQHHVVPVSAAPVSSPLSQQGFTPSEWADRDPFSPMDCSDIIIGAARGNYHRVRDTYSRGWHTPLPDSIWGGRDDLTGAVAWENSGVTTIAFRRRMDATDGPDHSVRGDMQVIWARGQEPGETVAVPQHQLVPGNPTVSPFYVRDEIKYHGLGSQRGYLFIDFDAVRKEFVNGKFSQ